MQTLMIIPHAIDEHLNPETRHGAYTGPCALTSQAQPHEINIVEGATRRCPTCGRTFEMHQEGSAYVVSLVQ